MYGREERREGERKESPGHRILLIPSGCADFLEYRALLDSTVHHLLVTLHISYTSYSRQRLSTPDDDDEMTTSRRTHEVIWFALVCHQGMCGVAAQRTVVKRMLAEGTVY